MISPLMRSQATLAFFLQWVFMVSGSPMSGRTTPGCSVLLTLVPRIEGAVTVVGPLMGGRATLAGFSQ